MPDPGPGVRRNRLLARIRAVLPTEWFGAAGERFRKGITEVSEFAQEHRVTPADLARDGVDLGRRKLEGLANAEYAQALRNYAEEESIKVNAELQRRNSDSKIRQERALADKLEAEASAAKVKEIEAWVDLVIKLEKLGLVPTLNAQGDICIQDAPRDFDWAGLKRLVLSRVAGELDPPRVTEQTAGE